MQPKRLIVIGTSAGGIEALRTLVAALPADFPAAVAIVIHTGPGSPGVLHEILGRVGTLPTVSPTSGTALRGGHIYVAPPDYHLLIEPGRVRLTKGPRENRFRPAIDPLFRSAAQVYGPAAIGVVLTGNLDDGSAGLWAVKQLGGVAIVQDPADALFPAMPENALAYVRADHCVPLIEIPPLLVRLTAASVPEPLPVPAPESMEVEVKIANEEDPLKAGIERIGSPSTYGCPECHGVLLQLKEAGRIRFRCHTGHAYSAESLLAEINESIEGALWNAIRLMHEGDLLMRQLADHLDNAHPQGSTSELRSRGDELLRRADTLRELVTAEPSAATAKP